MEETDIIRNGHSRNEGQKTRAERHAWRVRSPIIKLCKSDKSRRKVRRAEVAQRAAADSRIFAPNRGRCENRRRLPVPVHLIFQLNGLRVRKNSAQTGQTSEFRTLGGIREDSNNLNYKRFWQNFSVEIFLRARLLRSTSMKPEARFAQQDSEFLILAGIQFCARERAVSEAQNQVFQRLYRSVRHATSRAFAQAAVKVFAVGIAKASVPGTICGDLAVSVKVSRISVPT
jgi:hypothetical protein